MIYIAYNTIIMKHKYITLKKWHESNLTDPKYVKEYKSLDVEFSIIHDILLKRIEKDMTQEDLAYKSGIGQATISRLESGNYNPSIKFLKRVAEALGTKLTIRLA